MPNDDHNQTLRELKRRLDTNDEALQRLSDLQDWRVEIARIVERLTTIVVGDPAINHKGLVERVQGHETFIQSARDVVERVQGHETFITAAKDQASETKGSRKTMLVICGIAGAILAKLIDMGFQLLTAHVGK